MEVERGGEAKRLRSRAAEREREREMERRILSEDQGEWEVARVGERDKLSVFSQF